MSLDYKKIFSYVISGIILCTMTVYEASCADWSSFRGNPENNAAVSCKTPRNADEAVMYWSLKKGESFESSSIGSPIIADDCIIFCNGNTLYKADRYTGKILAQNEMYTNSSYNIISPTYSDGMIYVGLSNAVLLAQKNNVKLVDIVEEKCNLINMGKSPIAEKEIEISKKYDYRIVNARIYEELKKLMG